MAIEKAEHLINPDSDDAIENSWYRNLVLLILIKTSQMYEKIACNEVIRRMGRRSTYIDQIFDGILLPSDGCRVEFCVFRKKEREKLISLCYIGTIELRVLSNAMLNL